jgi:uncharacterized repeat protein (TIGR01451 family)
MRRRGSLRRLGLMLIVFAGAVAGLASQGAASGDGLVPPVLPPGEPPDPPTPVVKIRVRVPACALPGRAIEYRICVENCSPAEAHHVVVKNPLPANARFIKADPEPARLVPEVQWHLGTVGGGATREIVLWLMPTDCEEVKNCARYSSSMVSASSPGRPRCRGRPGWRRRAPSHRGPSHRGPSHRGLRRLGWRRRARPRRGSRRKGPRSGRCRRW